MTVKGTGPGHVYSSAMCLAAYTERDTLSLNHLTEIHWEFVTRQITLEGIYVFGGIKGEQADTRIKDTNLYRLSIGEKVNSWSIVETTGP